MSKRIHNDDDDDHKHILDMSGYESDSSGAEDDYTETNILLGYASKEPTEDSISQLGGHPVCDITSAIEYY